MLRPDRLGPVPEETARVARAAFPRGNVYLRLRDALGSLYDDEAFAPLFAALGQPAEAPWRLAVVTVLQFAEGLSDRQAADAVRSRIDWKYLLALELRGADAVRLRSHPGVPLTTPAASGFSGAGARGGPGI